MSPTLTMRPTHAAAGFDRPPDLSSISDDVADRRRRLSYGRPSTAGAVLSTYPMYSRLQTPNADKVRSINSMQLNRPRRLSGTSPEYASPGSRLQAQTGMRTWTTSFGSGPSYDQLHSSPWRLTNTPPSLRRPKSRARLSVSLPGEVLDVILEMLKELHLEQGSESCATCWMRDVCNIALCSRKFLQAAKLALYQDIQLVGSDSTAHKKRFKSTQGCRMTLLRRTLRANGEIASMVRSLKVPAAEDAAGGPNGKGASEEYENSVAALVMACPNLERLSGPVFGYNHSHRRLFHALSTRDNLKDVHWRLEPTASSSPQRAVSNSSKECLVSESNRLQTDQEVAFLELHRRWTKLSSLTVQCLPDATLAPDTLLARTLTVLPSLQHLHLHGLPADAFNDSNLLSLPPVQSLTLSNIRGISSRGLSSFATRANSQRLRSLDIRHTPLTSLPALARLFSNLRSLARFSLVQSFPPLMPESDSFVLWMMPYLASTSVNSLHWDITSHPDSTNPADEILAQSIRAGGFPCLQSLRTPNDPEGVFQQLCRPVARIDLPRDWLRATSSVSEHGSAPSSPVRQLSKSMTTSSLPAMIPASTHTNLVLARMAAQTRLERARESHIIQVNVTDEHGEQVESFGLGGYLGTLGSKINYHLLPDAGATDEAGGLTDVPDLCADAGESLAGEGCTGSWNRREGIYADKKEKEKWWHTERGRWRRLKLA